MNNQANTGKSDLFHRKKEVLPLDGILSFPGFPLVLVCVKNNIITVAAVSFFSFKNPPMVMIGIVPKRFSYELIKETMDYSINIPTPNFMKEIKYCGSKSGRDVDKFAETTLTPMKAKKITSVLIKECPVSLECKVVHIINLGGTHVWFVGEVVAAHKMENYNRSQAIMYWPREYRKVGEVLEE
ncbi:MAG: flavin reductase family protein [Candidatus Hodarchaeota archaeon]